MASQGKKVVIVGAARTPIGAFIGTLASVPAPRLGATAIQAALQRSGVKPEDVQTVFMGEVLQGGVGQAPARQAAIYAGIPKSVPCVAVNKVCGSGLEAVIEGARVIALGEADVVVAGGMESMSNAPYFTHSLRTGARMGNVEFKDLMIHDGLWDPYNEMHMGMCGEKCAADFKFSRAAQDEYALESTRRAQRAQAEGAFKAEIVQVEIVDKKGNKTVVSEDEGPKLARPDKIAGLKASFKKEGTITAANASSINDGAAAVVLMSEERARKDGRTVLGRLVLGKLSFSTSTALRFTLALPVLLLIVMVQSGGAAFAHYQASDALPFLGIALIPGFLALLLYYRALRSTPATLATIAEMAYPVAATFIASAPPPYGFNQPLYLPQFIGTALLIAVIFILNYTKERTPPVIVEEEPAA